MDTNFDFQDIPDFGEWESFHDTLKNVCDSGFNLTESEVINSVAEASRFFNLGLPIDIHEDWTTGVMPLNPGTELDDILVYNRQQMSEMGISDKDSFDLVMTHECAHRALQGMGTGYSSHQEELCCDYMAGVRAGLNGMDESTFADSLRDTSSSLTHPNGILRTEAINEGIGFARDFINFHDGIPPRFSDCLTHFENSDVFRASYNMEGLVSLSPEGTEISLDGNDDALFHGYTQHDVEWYEKQARISSGTEQEHWLREAQWAKEHMHGLHEPANPDTSTDVEHSVDNISFRGYTESEIKSKIAAAESKIRYAESQIRSHSELLKNSNYPETEKMHINNAKHDLASAKAELNKWKGTKPDR